MTTTGIKLEEAPLWRTTFLTDNPGDSSFERETRLRLRLALLDMREQVGHLVSSIASDMPGLTVHDLTHLDALWEMAGLADGFKAPLNPAEGFVLGGAILLHDAALTLTAYPCGMDDLRKLPYWADMATSELRRLGHREPDAVLRQALPQEVELRISWRLLRRLHAQRAAELPAQVWRHLGEDHYLMNDPALRRHFGHTIGMVAASHHLATEELKHLHSDLGALPGTNWPVSTLRVACLLRVADALHVDSRRAPAFLAALRRPAAESAVHWTYQCRMTVPQVRGDQVVLTSSSPFPVEDAQAWWLCLDWARMLDRELRDVDRLLAEHALPRLLARSVHSVGDPRSFEADVRALGWDPVDATVRVSDVPALARKLGGEALYGAKPEVALRELIQNACDAIHARRLLEDDFRGAVKIRLENMDGKAWLVVEDDGCGMSAQTLTRSLLDFGQSFWQTGDVMDEFPGLLGRGFIPEGRFGIGFFSVFMLGTRVTVTSRRYDAGYDQVRCLVFAHGADARPIMTLPQSPRRGRHTTQVAVQLDDDKLPALLRCLRRMHALFPALGVDLSMCIEEAAFGIEAENFLEIAGDDWLTIDDESMFHRIGSDVEPESYPTSLIEHEGKVWGRAAVHHHGASSQVACVVDSLGIFIENADRGWCTGILRGNTTIATRSKSEVVIPAEALAAWGTCQAQLLWPKALSTSEACFAAAQVLLAGGDSGPLPLFAEGAALISPTDVDRKLLTIRELFVFFDSFFNDEIDPADKDLAWQRWCVGRTIWRAPAFFSSSCQALAALSGVSLETAYVNPVTERLVKRAELVWGGPVKVGSISISVPTRRIPLHYEKRLLLRISPMEASK